MGKFDKKAHKFEPDVKPKKKKIIPNFKNSKDEKSRNLGTFYK